MRTGMDDKYTRCGVYDRDKYLTNREKIIEKQKEYYRNNRERILSKQKEDRDKEKQISRKWSTIYEERQERTRVCQQRYYATHKEKLLKKVKEQRRKVKEDTKKKITWKQPKLTPADLERIHEMMMEQGWAASSVD